MSFVEIAFFWFILTVFVVYYIFSRNIKAQNIVLFTSSIIFYSWWNWKFSFLIVASIIVTYSSGCYIDKGRHRFPCLILSIAALLSTLAYFKYANFFVESFAKIVSAIGFSASFSTLNVLLPIGISFYTFQMIAYLVDVYRGDFKAERDFITFGAFVSFFPQLVAGPIERASHLLTQFQNRRTLTGEYIARGLWLMVLGYTMKVGVADVLAPSVELAFVHDQPSGWWVILGTYAFGLQIYGDFLGYSLIAKGVALLFGIELIWNFNFPYWATSISDFWRRWHISLSRWLRDYLYIPLGGSRGSRWQTVRNLLTTMVLGGLWHGASWTFVLWGLLHGIALSIDHLLANRMKRSGIGVLFGWLGTMIVVFAGWFLFRIRSLEQGRDMLAALGNLDWFPAHSGLLTTLLFLTGAVAILEYCQIRLKDRCFVLRWNSWAHSALSAMLVFYVLVVAQHTETQFIYFQF